jgi:hypothetical protein
MKKSKWTEAQIVETLRKHEQGIALANAPFIHQP